MPLLQPVTNAVFPVKLNRSSIAIHEMIYSWEGTYLFYNFKGEFIYPGNF
jgi:hypothetical protein